VKEIEVEPMRITAISVASDETITDVHPTSASASLLEQLGGRTALERMVDRFVQRITSDRRLAPHFARIDVAALKRSELAFFTAAFGGKPDLDWREPAIDLDGEAAGRVACHLYEVLLGFGLPERLNEDIVLAVISLGSRVSRSAIEPPVERRPR
jgi:hypothetical protein